MSEQKKSMALAYNLSKRNKHMCAHGGPAECAEGCYAEGGEIKGVNRQGYGPKFEPGTSAAGHHLRINELDRAKNRHKETIDEMRSDKRDRRNLAEGGEVDGYSPDMEPEGKNDLVERIIKKMSKGGMAANDDEPEADSMSADYDDLAMNDHLEGHDSGSNELGDEQESDDQHDMVGRIMLRRKKNGNPRPA